MPLNYWCFEYIYDRIFDLTSPSSILMSWGAEFTTISNVSLSSIFICESRRLFFATIPGILTRFVSMPNFCISVCQWLRTEDDKIKLGDFNRAEIMMYNVEKGKYCKYVNGECYGNVSRAPLPASKAQPNYMFLIVVLII